MVGLVELVGPDMYGEHEKEAKRRLGSRDPEDWPILASALALGCPIGTEDTDFFGCGIPTGSGHRMALVIDNNAYPWKPPVNSVNDARGLAAMLPQVCFDAKDVTLVVDANLKQMQKAGRTSSKSCVRTTWRSLAIRAMGGSSGREFSDPRRFPFRRDGA